jgi:hypothetical protein
MIGEIKKRKRMNMSLPHSAFPDQPGEEARMIKIAKASADQQTPLVATNQQTGKWKTFAFVALGVFMANLDASIVNMSLPAISQAFGTALNGQIEWVIIAYLMVIAGVLLTVGWLSDRIGRKPLWIAGVAIFTGGSLGCGVAPSLLLLTAARSRAWEEPFSWLSVQRCSLMLSPVRNEGAR